MSFLEESAATRKGALAWITRRQGYLFFPLLLLEGAQLACQVDPQPGLAYAGEGSLDRAGHARSSLHDLFRFDLLAVAVRHGVGFIGVQLAVFGLYMARPFRRITKAYLSRERPLEGRRLVNGLDQESLPCPVVRWEALDRGRRRRPLPGVMERRGKL